MTPTGPNSPPSLAKTRVFAAILIPASFVMAYFFMYRPVVEARQTGELHYYIKGILLPPLLLYMGICILFADLRDGQIKTFGPDGKPHLTSKGWSFVVGLFAVMGLTMAGWFFYLRTIGFQAF